MDKYYTPSIEEFHVGFEYEWRLVKLGIDWSKTQLTKDASFKSYTTDKGFTEVIGIKDLLEGEDSEIRVKYLDKEDIESLGFKGSKENSVYFTKADCLTSGGTNYLDCRLVHWFTDNIREVNIYAVYGKEDEQLIFRGIIKNKSELKTLLKQLGIDGK